jgi:hypothetical protein
MASVPANSTKSAWSLSSQAAFFKTVSQDLARGEARPPLGDITNRTEPHVETTLVVSAALQQDTENIIKQQMKKVTDYSKPGVLSRVAGMTCETAYESSCEPCGRGKSMYEYRSLIFRSEVRSDTSRSP